jgi:phage gpG-like protein
VSNSFTITVDDAKAVALLTGISQRAANPIEANKIIANMLRNDVKSHFDTQDGNGKQWKDLKPTTWKWKRANGYYNMLKNSGKLYTGNIPEATKDYARVYNAMNYAVKQNNGDDKTPARPWMWLSDKMLKRITTYMANYLVRKGLMSEWT